MRIEVDIKAKSGAKVIMAACAGCGACAAECRFDAITIRGFMDDQIMSQIDSALAVDPQNKIVSFLCNWCSYAASDVAGISRMQYPANNRFIRVMCSARVTEKFIWHAFKLGAPLVLLSGCHIGDCHYITANHSTQKRADRMWDAMEKLGIRPRGCNWNGSAQPKDRASRRSCRSWKNCAARSPKKRSNTRGRCWPKGKKRKRKLLRFYLKVK